MKLMSDYKPIIWIISSLLLPFMILFILFDKKYINWEFLAYAYLIWLLFFYFLVLFKNSDRNEQKNKNKKLIVVL